LLSADELKELGIVVGETTPYYVDFLSKRPARVGEYVLVEHEEGLLLAMVELSVSGNPFILHEAKDISTIKKTVELLGGEREYFKGRARLLAKFNELARLGKVNPPKTPPKTGGKVFEASNKTLRAVFAPENPNPSLDVEAYRGERSGAGYVRIGVLANHPDVPVYVRADSIVAKHLAVLAVTGAGKSNTVSILAERISNGLGGTVLVFDMHGEYAASGIGGRKCNIIAPKVNPDYLTFQEIKALAKIPSEAVRQERVLRLALAVARRVAPTRKNLDLIERARILLETVYELKSSSKSASAELLKRKLREVFGETAWLGDEAERPLAALASLRGKDLDPLFAVVNKLEELKAEYGSVIDASAPHDLKKVVKVGHVNIVDLSEVDERGCDVIVSFFMRRVLQERKRYVATRRAEGYPSPVLVVLEEAHVLIPREGETFTKAVAARIAREGRKFGVGLCLVSQRPKGLDENALSQMNNKIILKIVEPHDMAYVQRASEQLSTELLELLPSLNVGEAIVLGEMAILPALVKIDEHPRKLYGRDVKVAEEWRLASQAEEDLSGALELQEL